MSITEAFSDAPSSTVKTALIAAQFESEIVDLAERIASNLTDHTDA